MWVQSGAPWNDQSLEYRCPAFVDSLYALLKPALNPGTGQYGVPDLQLGSQWADPPRLLLDSHTFLWWVRNDRALKKRARALIADAGNDCYVSHASVWEMAI